MEIWRVHRNFDFLPTNEIFSKNRKISFLKKRVFWGYEVENRFFGKMVLQILPILWIRVKTVNTQLSLTFFHKNRPYRPIYQKIKKIIFSKKMAFFESKICPRGLKMGPIGKARQSKDRINIPYKRIITDFSYQNIKFFRHFLLIKIVQFST